MASMAPKGEKISCRALSRTFLCTFEMRSWLSKGFGCAESAACVLASCAAAFFSDSDGFPRPDELQGLIAEAKCSEEDGWKDAGAPVGPGPFYATGKVQKTVDFGRNDDTT